MNAQTLESSLELPLGVLPNVGLAPNQLDLLRELENFEAPYLEEKLLSNRAFESPQEYQKAFKEFKRFAFLANLYSGNLGMVGKKIDEVWHQFILFTPQYHKFCEEMFSKYLHHQPKTSYTPLSQSGKKSFFRLYKQTFGELPRIWGRTDESECCRLCDGASCSGCDS